MPTYQYRCTACGKDLEVFQKFTDPSLTQCPSCSGELRKVFNAVGVVFKGSGFYTTDSRKSKSMAQAGKSDGESSPGKSDGESSPGESDGESSPGKSDGESSPGKSDGESPGRAAPESRPAAPAASGIGSDSRAASN